MGRFVHERNAGAWLDWRCHECRDSGLVADLSRAETHDEAPLVPCPGCSPVASSAPETRGGCDVCGAEVTVGPLCDRCHDEDNLEGL